MQPIADSSFVLKADLVLLAMGFVSPVHEGLVEQSGVALDGRGNVSADTRTIIPQRYDIRLWRHAAWTVARGLGD